MSIAENLATIAENVPKVYEAGKQAENKAFWDIITLNNTRPHYGHTFRYWDVPYVRPPYKITPTARGGTLYMFANNPNLLKVEKEYFDLSQLPNQSQTNGSFGNQCIFTNCPNLVEIEDIGITAAMYDTTYYGCSKLERIEIIRVQEDTTFYNAFSSCRALKHLTVEGVIGTNFSIAYSPLTKESMKSIITHLKDYSGTSNEYKYTVTFNPSAFSVLEAEGATAEYNGVPCTWAELIDNLKWNLVKA